MYYRLFIFFLLLNWSRVCAEEIKEEIKVNHQKEEHDSTQTTVIKKENIASQGRSKQKIDQKEILIRLPRSTPEALQGMSGTYIQQTAHGQASAYIRGRTGRHTLLMINGFRLNHSLFRQGPNQYLFTIDPLSIESIEVIRGGAGVILGGNAVSGSILVTNKKPKLDLYLKGQKYQPTFIVQHSTADDAWGGRVGVEAQLHKRWGLYVAVGGMQRGELEAAGSLPLAKNTPQIFIEEKEVPRFREDGRTQMGTGFKMLNTDTVLRWKPTQKLEFTGAVHLFRQYDSPRTDQCPPPEAPDTWCLKYDEQFRTQSYGRMIWRTQLAGLDQLNLGLSYQRQHEKRTNDRENYINQGRDDVDILEMRLQMQTKTWKHQLSLHYGFDTSYEWIESKAWDTLVRSEITQERSRGQYIAESTYQRADTWANLSWQWKNLKARFGTRVTYNKAESPGDEKTESKAIHQNWTGIVLGGGLTWQAHRYGQLVLNIDEGFAPPNLDDLTARQLTGQGFQIENADLGPEKSISSEIGVKITHTRFYLAVWGFHTMLKNGIERRDTVCPESDRSCRAARIATPFTLINLPDHAYIWGVEQNLKVKLPAHFVIKQQISWAKGEGPSPIAYEYEDGKKRPLSRIPPLNGLASLKWEHPRMLFYLGYENRWALAQDLLSFGDEIDRRIPFGGTPGYVSHHMFAGLHLGDFDLNVFFENMTDEIYRVHGSSINGAGRSLSILLRYQPTFKQ